MHGIDSDVEPAFDSDAARGKYFSESAAARLNARHALPQLAGS